MARPESARLSLSGTLGGTAIPRLGAVSSEPRGLFVSRAASPAIPGPGLHRIVELRFFGGVPEQDIARLLGVSARTVERTWKGELITGF